MWQWKFKTSRAYLVAICWTFLLLMHSGAFSWFHYKQRPDVCLRHRVCGLNPYYSNLGGFIHSFSRSKRFPVLQASRAGLWESSCSLVNGMGWPYRWGCLSFSSLSPILVEAHQSVTDYPCSTSAVFIPIPPPKQGKTLVNVGLLWDSTAIMKPLVLPGAFVPHRRLGSSPAICWG